METQIWLGPELVTANNVQYWCRHVKELAHSQVHKAQQFIDYDCVHYIGKAIQGDERVNHLRDAFPDAKHAFLVLPLNTDETFDWFGIEFKKKPFPMNYNSSEYIIFKRKDRTFECNCQAWQTKKRKQEIKIGGANCSHVLALYFAFKIRKFNKEHGAEEGDNVPDMMEETK